MTNKPHTPHRPHRPNEPHRPHFSKNICSLLLMILLLPTVATAQITISGSIYGGGNKGETGGNTNVTVYQGDLDKVFGGARMADVDGRSFVNIDGEHASGYILINYVYGGNDISGTIGGTPKKKSLPTELTSATANDIDSTWDAYVRVSRSTKEETTGEGSDAVTETVDDQKIYIGQLFGGGNGNYELSQTTNDETGTTTYTISDRKTGDAIASNTTGFTPPALGKTYLELLGGSIVYAYGGGNNATVTEKTVIYLNNESEVVNRILVNDAGEEAPAAAYEANGANEANGSYHDLLTDERLRDKMGINLGYSFPTSAQYQIGNFYGGNNTAEMAIRPVWNLKKGKIRNLYSGGNRGAMTSPEGLLLEIKPENDADLVVENVYGGCRMADVKPTVNGNYTPTVNLTGYNFPDGFSARLLVRGGTITNVYGGNDIRGKVYGGNALGIYTSILGDVYGGGNGSYPYTDNESLKNSQTYGDFYYSQSEVPGAESSVDALNAIRPNAEQVSLRVWGPSEADPTVIRGSIYLGGNSATLAPSGVGTPTVELKIGSNVIADKVFLGNNGANMVATNERNDAAHQYEGVLRTMQRTDLSGDGSKFSSIALTDADAFAKYMEGAAMDLMPSVVFDDKENKGDPDTYKDHSTYFGSFYCGGNVGSMTKDGCEVIDFNHQVVIFDKLVGGCNNAIVPEQKDGAITYNARYEGGLIGNSATSGNRLELNLSGLLVEPMRWKAAKDDSPYPFNYLEWNTWLNGLQVDAVTTLTTDTGKDYKTSDANDHARRLMGGNIYGGCYTSGIVNGNVVININGTIIDRDKLFDKVESDELGEEISLYGNSQLDATEYHITERRTGVILGEQGMDVLGSALNVFGGGKGKDTEIWGNTVVNLNRGYTFQIFGGSEEGVIGKPVGPSAKTDYDYTGNKYSFNGKLFENNAAYSCYVNLCGEVAGVSKASDSSDAMAECEFMYGGGFFGPVCGNTVINMGNGRIFNSFAGSCMADILGTAQTFMGRQVKAAYKVETPDNIIDRDRFEPGFPWVRDIVYGGNDLGGRILGEDDFSSHVRGKRAWDETDFDVWGKIHNTDLLRASAYVEYQQGRADAIFGGHYGTYDYKDPEYKDYFYTTGGTGTTPENLGTAHSGYTKPRMGNAFVNFRPTLTNDLKASPNNYVNRVYGGSQGYPDDQDRDIVQRSSYVLIDIPQGMDDANAAYPHYKYMEVFGGGAWCGLGMQQEEEVVTPELFADWTNAEKDRYSASIDLARGHIGAAYGGSQNEGVVRRTWVNVPSGSTIEAGSLFAGGYGSGIFDPCDVYEGHVEYHSTDALMVNDRERTTKDGQGNDILIGHKMMLGAIYGGNNASRRTLYGNINIDVPVRQRHYQYGMTKATVYGAGYGSNTWNEYTEVNLNRGAEVYEVYGGGEAGGVMSAESITAYYATRRPDDLELAKWQAAWTIGGGYDPESYDKYHENQWTNLSNKLARTAEVDDRSTKTYKYNTNVIIHQDAYVGNYAYGGGLGKENDKFVGSGDVYGTTYIALLGGMVAKDVYAAGTSGAVYNIFGSDLFTASANAYIAGGSCRNVYGGGWQGDVGYTPWKYTKDGWQAPDENDNTPERPGETHVVIGIRPDQSDDDKLAAIRAVAGPDATLADYGFSCGVPAIQRNAYAGGEGGAVFGTANLVLNNGYIGYVHLNDGEEQDERGNIVTAATTTAERYEEKITDETYFVQGAWQGKERLRDCGNVFGGGYDVRSSVDTTNITIWNGSVRNSVHGGGEIATVGRGATEESGEANSERILKAIYQPGATHVTMYNGHVMRNIFGGGKGYNIWGYGTSQTLYTDGYVFGSTEVNVYGGEVGTEEGVADGYGNVFGGGDIGFVYSGSINDGNHDEETGSPGHYYYKDKNDKLTEDCRVVVSPYLQVMDNTATINGKDYAPYAYVPTEDLNTLPGKVNGQWTGEWQKFFTEATTGVQRGITIHNAVFAGGNVSSNSDTHYANATSVFGNVTATLNDVYHRDFITIGTEHIGGIYGGGNLTLVNGYRELNITNYGTDYYGLAEQITLDEYHSLTNRERAYFQLQYICKDDITFGGQFYHADERISEDDYLKLLEKYGDTVANAFTPYGFCSIYAGRLLNTIQRADFCGVFGSRMVLQGAKDRVADVGEDIPYTINRVGELSLNQQNSTAGDTGDQATHGNYFGIYSVVNHLGNLTSDVKFNDLRKYKEGEKDSIDTQSYYAYKKSKYGSGAPKSDRNRGVSANKVALASGVFLELTTEKSTEAKKDYGYITGVVELDLINAKKDLEGGGFVYAKNEHRVPKYFPNKENVLLSEYNMTKSSQARTYRRFYYEDSNLLPSGTSEVFEGETEFTEREWETSGNFIHPSKTIVDDCYPTNNAYLLSAANHSEAHYWYIKGAVYIYDQEVSAYTGAANAYSKAVHLPLTITAASHGRLQLLNVKPNLYAYYAPDPADDSKKVKIGSVTDADGKLVDKVWVNNEYESYGLNDVITWWDWHQMSYKDRQYFVPMTYVNTEDCIIDGTEYAAGKYVLSEADLATFEAASHTIVNAEGDEVSQVEDVFRRSNNIGHKTGYALTFNMDTPKGWDHYYTKETDKNAKLSKEQYEKLATGKDDYIEGPTYSYPLATDGIYGERDIQVGDILTKVQIDASATDTENNDAAKVEPAYVAKTSVTYTYGGTSKTASAGTAIPKTEYDEVGTAAQAAFDEAYFCIQTLKLSDNNYLTYGDVKSKSEIDALKSSYEALATDIDNAISPAYICSKEGKFGGKTYESGHNYSVLQTLCSMPADDFTNAGFTFNYDAFDLLTDPNFLKVTVNATDIVVDQANIKPETPSTESTESVYHSPYSDIESVEYNAVFKATAEKPTYSYKGGTLANGDVITNEEFEHYVRNDKVHYTRVTVKEGGEDVYIAKESFVYNGVPYAKGQIVDESVLSTGKAETVHFDDSGTQFYCFENYDDAANVTIAKGTIISEAEYAALPNDQKYFVIQGKEPTETTTLYVSSQSEAKDVMKERVYTVVYQYTYYDEDDDGDIKLNNELHVVNIHLVLESGAPSVGLISPPGTVLPGDAVGLKAPEVKPGLYEVFSNGWELFQNENDALHHRNGTPFVNNVTPVYWYQHQKQYLAFYSKTYLGKTYSKNYVPLSVANYHDLDEVMKDTEHHLYVDHPDVLRPSKVYIDDRACESDPAKSELDLLKDFFDLSVLDGSAVEGSALEGHAPLDPHVRAGRNLDFILRSDISPKAYTPTAPGGSATWTPIGNDNVTVDDPLTPDVDESTTGQCFSGTLHGDGHTISGLDHSLFGHLCGEVYNLGVTGSFTTAGIADKGDGYIENCWVKTSAVSGFAADTKAVFGHPNDDGGTHVVNCYYPSAPAPYYAAGPATPMPEKAFYNGTVAYNLNGFYLKKRFYDSGSSSATAELGGSPISYRYLPSAADGTLPADMATARYPDDAYHHYQPVGTTEQPNLGYVEHRFYDGDFVYAGGTIPETNNFRLRSLSTTDVSGHTTVSHYYTPIWPDDYLFFGQTLTYGHIAARPHQDTPAAINRSSDRLSTADLSNRVYRAPAYFRSSDMDVAHFNPAAVFAQTKSGDPTVTAYKGMTAIDFTGHNDYSTGSFVKGWANLANGAYEPNEPNEPNGPNKPQALFFPPLLDDDGLSSFQNVDLTQNLLVYTGTATDAATLTDGVVSNYLHDNAYAETNDKYHTVGVWDSYSSTVHGHWVQLTGSDSYVAQRDHMLVDKHDFNAPIAYNFADGHRMWYQRKPTNYVETVLNGSPAQRTTKGWEGISLPFKTEVVTTQQKGELTHFYSVVGGSAADMGRVGHEYWLREYKGGAVSATDSKVFEATLKYPDANSGDGQKDYSNTFLWDYYYSHNDYDDQNGDDYQENDVNRTYYKQGREYPDYPRMAAATPYIIGFPGVRYYEFDLSGNFTPTTALATIPGKLDQQVITFASATGTAIGVSDLEKGEPKDGYTFRTNYLNETFAPGTVNTYTLNSDGDSYESIPTTGDAVSVGAFHPYFVKSASPSRQSATRSIVFANVTDEAYMPHESHDSDTPGTITIGARRHTIVVSSSLQQQTTVHIVNAGGATVAIFTLQPGESVNTPIPVAGIYLVRTADGRFTKKLFVK